jgi:hypothetical protein
MINICDPGLNIVYQYRILIVRKYYARLVMHFARVLLSLACLMSVLIGMIYSIVTASIFILFRLKLTISVNCNSTIDRIRTDLFRQFLAQERDDMEKDQKFVCSIFVPFFLPFCFIWILIFVCQLVNSNVQCWKSRQ